MINMKKERKIIMDNEWTGVYWNTRFIERKETWKSEDNSNKEYFNIYFDLHEVHYDKNNKPIAWTSEPDSLTFNNEDDVKMTIKHIQEALNRTVLRKDNYSLIDTGKLLKHYKQEELTNFDHDLEYDHCCCEEENHVHKEGN